VVSRDKSPLTDTSTLYYSTLLDTSTEIQEVMSTVVNACGTINTSYGMKMKMGMVVVMG